MFVEINCPSCGEGSIRLEPELLLEGASFACDHCHASVAVAQESQSALKGGLAEFHKLRRQVSAIKAEEACLQ